MSNFPPGMSGSDWDHVEGIARCKDCGAQLPEHVPCGHCGGYSRGLINACEHCFGYGVVEFDGETCPRGCYDEP